MTGVLLVGNFLSHAGGSRGVCEDLAVRLAEAGWQVSTASTRSARIPRLADMLATAWRRRHAYEVAHVDVFSGPAFIWAEAVAWLLRRLNKPYILTLRGGSLPSYARRYPRRVSALLRSAAVVTTPSGYLLEHMQPYCPALRLLPNPIDLPLYPFHRREAPRPLLVWLRAFHTIYNPSLAVEVVARLAREFPGVRLLMVGPDKGDGSLQKAQAHADRLGVRERVTFAGGVPKREVGEWLSRGDIFINTTSVDNTPVSVIEAMACGLCVVSTSVGGIPYLLEHEQDALLVPPGDAEAMAAAVRRILTDGELAARLSQNARCKVEVFDWSVILPEWEQLLLQANIKNTG